MAVKPDVAVMQGRPRTSTRAPRFRRRLAVRFRCEGASRPGFTLNVSQSGALIVTQRPPPLGSVVDLEIVLRDGCRSRVRALVARLELPPAPLRRLVPSHVGMHFLDEVPSFASLTESRPALERRDQD